MLNSLLKKIRKRSTPAAIILMYHRIDKEGMDPWSLCVTPEHFAEQLEVIRDFTNPVSLETLVHNMIGGNLTPLSTVVTFDDGYSNNLINAKPLLEKFHIPATFFITTGKIDSSREYWWDELEQLLLKPGRLPRELVLEIKGSIHRWVLDKSTDYTDDEYKNDYHLKAWQGQEDSRHHLYYSIWQRLQPLPETERLRSIKEIIHWSDSTLILRQSHQPLKKYELNELYDNGLFEIGTHTVNHPSLAIQNKHVQVEEILCSKETLENILQSPISSFAYPHGEYSKETINILKSLGFKYACTTEESVVGTKRNIFELPRLQVEDWDGKYFRNLLETFFTS